MSQEWRPDLEAQRTNDEKASQLNKPRLDSEDQVPTNTKFTHLSIYFLCNVSLTIYNKAVLGKFAYPYLLTTLHALAASIGCFFLLLRGTFHLTPLSRKENFTLALFSFLFTINVAISNVSLSMVSLPFHQILRSTTPLFTIAIYRLLYKRSYSTRTYVSLIPVVVGVGLATYGDYYFTSMGFALTLLGVVLAAVKTVATNRIMTGSLKLSPLEVLLRMSPLACIQGLFYAFLSGEVSALNLALPISPTAFLSQRTTVVLIGNGLLAFLLNVASFSANKNTGALTMTVCGNVKQCLTVVLGIAIFGVRVGWINGLGMIVALGGAGWYSLLEVRSKGRGN